MVRMSFGDLAKHKLKYPLISIPVAMLIPNTYTLSTHTRLMALYEYLKKRWYLDNGRLQ